MISNKQIDAALKAAEAEEDKLDDEAKTMGFADGISVFSRLVFLAALEAAAIIAKEETVLFSFKETMQHTESKAGMKWKKIESAPQDGTPILACSMGPWPDSWSQGLHPTTIRWRTFHPNSPGKLTWRQQDGKPVFPSHWMPLPPDPTANKK